jgi:hypothetical protein
MESLENNYHLFQKPYFISVFSSCSFFSLDGYFTWSSNAIEPAGKGAGAAYRRSGGLDPSGITGGSLARLPGNLPSGRT